MIKLDNFNTSWTAKNVFQYKK